ncbi:MAG: AEC family transporter [Opitutaceae bacterium]
MPSYWQLLLLILPVFLLIGIGAGLRRVGWLTAEADASLLKVVVNFLYPTLIFDSVLGNVALQQPGNLVYAPLVGFVTMAGGIGLSLAAGRAMGLTTGHGLRTFAFAVGIYNYGYIPIPLMTNLFGKESLGVLMVHNVGCEAAIWTVGILVLSGLSLREGWRKLLNPPVAALVIALVVNGLHWTPYVPSVIRDVVRLCAACAVPLALMLIGASVWEHFTRPQTLVDRRITPYSCLLRLCLFPLLFLVAAKFLPCPVELKRVMVVEAAMPAGILSLVIAKHYGGQPLTAVQVVVGTTVGGLVVIPLWLKLGLAWVLPT